MTKEDWDEWKALPETQEFFSHLSSMRVELQERWSQGMFTGSNTDETIQLNSKAIGEFQALSDVLEMTHEDFTQTL